MFSIIITFYKGEKYLSSLFNNLTELSKRYYNQSHQQTQIIIVNDSPEYSQLNNLPESEYYELKIVNNPSNCGIHLSRVNGLKEASHPYVIFLDQDDALDNDILCIYDKFILDHPDTDWIISNCYFETSDLALHPLYVSDFDFKLASKESSYLLIRDFIASPGQCLLKKDRIPEEWCTHILKNNGSDDALLWYYMFDRHLKVYTQPKCIYTHKYTGGNLMFETAKMDASMQEVINILSTTNYSKSSLKKLKASFDFKTNYYKSKSNYLKYVIKHPFVFLYNVYYKLNYKGYTVK